MKRKLLKIEMTSFILVVLCWISFGGILVNDINALIGNPSLIRNQYLGLSGLVGSILLNIIALILAIIAIKIDYRATFAKASIWLGIPFNLMLIYGIYTIVKMALGFY